MAKLEFTGQSNLKKYNIIKTLPSLISYSKNIESEIN